MIALLVIANAVHYSKGSSLPSNPSSDYGLLDKRPKAEQQLPKWLGFNIDIQPSNKNLFFAAHDLPQTLPANIQQSDLDSPEGLESDSPIALPDTIISAAEASSGIEVLAISINQSTASCLLKIADEIVVAGEGDIIDGRYHLIHISENAVYLTAL